MFQFIELAV